MSEQRDAWEAVRGAIRAYATHNYGAAQAIAVLDSTIAMTTEAAEDAVLVLSTPVEPAGASEPPKKWIPTEGCTCYLCRAARLSPAPVSPVAPEPPTETRSELWEVREQLAALAHEQWAGWMAHVFRKCEQREGGWWMPAEWADRWLRQIATPYLFLTPSEQDSDRKEAERVLGVMLTVAPTGAPAPCVWRPYGSGMKMRPGCNPKCVQVPWTEVWTHCPQCGHPLTVER